MFFWTQLVLTVSTIYNMSWFARDFQWVELENERFFQEKLTIPNKINLWYVFNLKNFRVQIKIMLNPRFANWKIIFSIQNPTNWPLVYRYLSKKNRKKANKTSKNKTETKKITNRKISKVCAVYKNKTQKQNGNSSAIDFNELGIQRSWSITPITKKTIITSCNASLSILFTLPDVINPPHQNNDQFCNYYRC